MTDPTPLDVDLVRRYLHNRDEDIRRMGLLEEATNRLAEGVLKLTQSLTDYATTGRVADIEHILDEHDIRFETRAKELIRLRLRIRRRTNVMFGITCVLLAVVSAIFAYYTVSYRHDRVVACQDRNHQLVVQAQQTKAFFAPKLVQEEARPHSDPVLTSILETLASSKPTLIKCSG